MRANLRTKLRDLNKLKTKPQNNTEEIIYLDDLPNKTSGVTWVLDREVITSTSYVINLDKDVTDPHHYREIVELLLTMGENDVAHWNINTWGGDLYTTIMLVDAIRQSGGHNYGIVTLGSSAGSIIALALDDCEVIPHGEMFIHSIQSHHSGDTYDQIKRLNFLEKKQRKLMEDIYEGFLTEEEIEKLMVGEIPDLTLDDDECNTRLEQRRKIKAERMKENENCNCEKGEIENNA